MKQFGKNISKNIFSLKFRNPISYLLLPIVVCQLLLYFSSENIIPAFIFFFSFIFIGNYTHDALYKLGLPFIFTLIIVRFDILKRNTWEGMTNTDKDDEEDADKQTTHSTEDGKPNDKEKQQETEDHEEPEQQENVPQLKINRENLKNKLDNSDLSKLDTTKMNGNIDNIENAVDRLEHSFDRIMKMGSKLGIDKQLSSLTKSLDINGILNQTTKL